jgi:hypothetical protein
VVSLRTDSELQAEREAIEKQLEEARNFQFMREGEITTLRRAMEKVSTVLAELDFACIGYGLSPASHES